MDLPRTGYLQFGVGEQTDVLRLGDRARIVVKPLAHPASGFLSVPDMHAMRRVGLEEREPVRLAKRAKDCLRVTHRLAGGIDFKKVLGRSEDGRGSREAHQRVIDVFDSMKPLASQVLATVRRTAFALEFIGALHGVAGRRRGPDPVVERHQEGCLGAAPAGAGHADRLGAIHFRP